MFSRCMINCPIVALFSVEFPIQAALPRPGKGGGERSEVASHSCEAFGMYPIRYTVGVEEVGGGVSHLTSWQNPLE